MRAVPVPVGDLLALDEALGLGHPVLEIGVGQVHARVEDGDLDALAGQPRLPGRGRTDLGVAGLHRGVDPGVQPDLLDAATRRTRPEAVLRAPEVTSGATVRQNSPDVDASRAAPPTLGRPRTWRAPCGVALRAFFVYVTMSGSPSEDGSPSPCSIRAVTSKSSASRTPAWR